MRKNGILLLMLLLIVPAGKAHGWGAVYDWCMTHQEIDTQAYLLLQQDPAFKGSEFPLLPEILAYEGVKSERTEKVFDMTGLGPGPDAMYASPYAWHYYNPATHAGKAPGAVSAQFYFALSPENPERTKGACWAAHFLADMSVPYHVVGMPRAEAVDHALNSRDLLSEDDTGPLLLYTAWMREQQTPAQGWGLLHNFSEATRYYVHNLASEEADWYDPWYANGYGMFGSHKVGTSSHVLWEVAANRHFDMTNYPHAEGRYNPVWTNAAPNYGFADDFVPLNQSAQAVAFTASVAAFTRNRIENIHQNPVIGLNNAIRNVATLWRASISGLRPQLDLFENEGQPNSYRIECRIRNTAGDAALDPAVQLTLRYPDESRIFHQRLNGSIAPGSQAVAVFNVEIAPGTSCEATAEVVAAYGIPDLQYATASIILSSWVPSPEALAPAPPPLVTPAPPPPAEGTDPGFTLWRGGLDKQQQEAVLSKKSGGKYYERYDADEMTLRFDRRNKPVELVGPVARTIVIVVTGKDYEIRYNFETLYTPKSNASGSALIVDRLTHKTTTTTTIKPPNKRDQKTSVETFHDPNCKLQVIKKEADSGDILVVLPHGSSNAQDVPWRLHQVSP